MTWEAAIDSGVHVQLDAQSKIFSGASATSDVEPNVHTSMMERALPGMLPVVSREVIEKAAELDLALDVKTNQKNVSDCRSYFYPDLSKSYQTNRLDLPVAEHDKLETAVDDDIETINVTRVHMEGDAGKSMREDLNGAAGINLNRTDTPLLEVVFEPEMCSTAEAVAHAKVLHGLVI